jgi:hypothetical protein
VGKVAMDHRLRKVEYSHQCVSTGAGGSLDMRIGPAAWARSCLMGQGLVHLSCSATAAGGTSKVGTGEGIRGDGGSGGRGTPLQRGRGWAGASRHRAACEILPMTRQRRMRAALRWYLRRLGVEGVLEGKGLQSGVPLF